MSLKWQRAKAWDDQHLRGVWTPLRILLRVFSSIATAVVLLTLVSIYGILASVPIGLLAKIPTLAFYAFTLVAMLAVGAVLPAWLSVRSLKKAQPDKFALRWTLGLTIGVTFSVIAAWAWGRFVWPPMHYDPATGSGIRFFSSFIEAYQSTTLRRLPGVEMSELEFYAWWPLRLILLLFVANMIVATVRRIEFTFKNIGVLTVHTGIVTIALGSVYYGGLKKEGDMLLLAGAPGPDGNPTPGPPGSVFYDNTDVALYVEQNHLREQRPMFGVPRYNEYNLAAIGAGTIDSAPASAPQRSAMEVARRRLPWEQLPGGAIGKGELDIPVVSIAERFGRGVLDKDIQLRVVGYTPYAEPVSDWIRVDPANFKTVRAGESLNPLRVVYLHSALPDEQGNVSDAPAFSFVLVPASPKERVADNAAFGIEYTVGTDPKRGGMTPQRFTDLATEIPTDAAHALIVEVGEPGSAGLYRAAYAVAPGKSLTIGKTGWTIDVKELHPEPPFPIITKGYEGASSSVAVVRVTPPDAVPFDRWIYHRFPEIAQDMLEEKNAQGMPTRRDPDARIRIAYIDASRIQVYLHEEASQGAAPAPIKAIVRYPGGERTIFDSLPNDTLADFVPKISLKIGERWPHAERIERPAPTPAIERDKSLIGNHDKAMLGVEVSTWTSPGTAPSPAAGPARKTWSRVVWLPFAKYIGIGMQTERMVQLPDGRQILLAFGRRQHRLPDFDLQLADFQMIAYDHRGAPRDYQSIVNVIPARDGSGNFNPYQHITRLNAPLRAPFMWKDDRALPANIGGQLLSGLNPRQFKFSQAGWDAQGWRETQAQADAGVIPRPFAKFTILGVGNNPGIHVIAFGGILMGMGIPWAFYIKPWLVRRERDKIKAQLAAGTYVRPGTTSPIQPRTPAAATHVNGTTSPEPASVVHTNEPAAGARV